MINILDLSAVMALGTLKPNISWHSVTVWISLVLNNFIMNRLTEKFSDLTSVLFKGQTSRPYFLLHYNKTRDNSRCQNTYALLLRCYLLLV